MVKPNTFIVGAPKAGTSALAQYLSEHPNVFFSDPKEPFFWCRDMPQLSAEFFIESLDDYLSLFDDSDANVHSVIAEGSTKYLYKTNYIKNILHFNADAKFIVMLRNPIDMAHAYHMEQVYSLEENIKSFYEAWHAQPQREIGQNIPKNCRAPEYLLYGKVCSIGEQLSRLMEIVDRRNLHVIFQDQFIEAPLFEYKRVLEFLGIPYDDRSEFPKVNISHAHRSKALARLVLKPPAWMAPFVTEVRNHLIEHRYPAVEKMKSMLNKKQPREPLTPEFRLELYEYFKNDIKLLEQLTSRNLEHWK